MRRRCTEQENFLSYIRVMNENYGPPAIPAGAEAGILSGMYELRKGGKGKVRVQLLGSGTILREVLAAADLLQERFGIAAAIGGVPTFAELRPEAPKANGWNPRHPDAPRAKRSLPP